jgi:hypothetical protein
MFPLFSTLSSPLNIIERLGGENSCSVKGQAILDQEEKEGRREKTRTCAHETHFANLSSKDSCHEYEAAFCVKSCHQPTRLGKRLRLVWL